MTDTLDEMGPIDYLVVEFPGDREPDGSALGHLSDLVGRGIIRVFDLRFVRCAPDGTVVPVDAVDVGLHGSLDISLLGEAASGILDAADLEEAGRAVTPGCVAAILIYENRWAAPFAVALRRHGALLVSDGRISVQAFLASLESS